MFSQAEKDDAQALLGEAFSTFQEQISIYRTPKVAFVSSGPNFNFGFGEQQPAETSTYIPQSGVFWATVEYVHFETEQRLGRANQDINVVKDKADVVISVSGALARDYLEDCETIVLDGRPFSPISSAIPRGVFNREYYDCWLVRKDNGITNG